MILDEDLPRHLAERLQDTLPGAAAQKPFEPELSYGRHQGPAPANARQAAVLLLLYPARGHWHLPLTRRPDTLTRHAGQISFPGGQLDPGETPEQAAVRELHEELGGEEASIHMLGRLSSIYVFASNYEVTPCVAVTRRRPQFQSNPTEVANLLEPALEDLLNPENHSAHAIRRRGICFRAPHFCHQGYRIWGATSVILAELLALLK